MENVGKLLAIIPARKGSKGVIRKNIRTIGGVPLFVHTVRAVQDSRCADLIVISSDDPEICAWAESHGIKFLWRDPELATSETTISEVALSVISELSWQGNVGVFQPTSPLRSGLSIKNAYHDFIQSAATTLGSVIKESHLFWFSTDGDPEFAKPMFKERVNRQYSSQAIYKETGAIQFSTSEHLVAMREIVSSNHKLFVLPSGESEDIDEVSDFRAVQQIFDRGLVVFRFEANRVVGTGHMYHCLQLAEGLDHHEIVFLLRNCDDFAIDLLRDRGWNFQVEVDLDSDLSKMPNCDKKVIVNDVLDTEVDEILVERLHGFKIVNIEDLGPGAEFADAVINALYSKGPTTSSVVTLLGAKYATLRSEFLDLPKKDVRERITKILISFGGTDPAELTQRIAKLLVELIGVEITAVLGIGAADIEPIEGVRIVRNIQNMAVEISRSDLVITAAGRTVFEAAAAATPVLSIAQNVREATHSHLSMASGVIYLGVGGLVTDAEIIDAVKMLDQDYKLRLELSERLLSLTDGKGVQRVCDFIDGLMRAGA